MFNIAHISLYITPELFIFLKKKCMSSFEDIILKNMILFRGQISIFNIIVVGRHRKKSGTLEFSKIQIFQQN